VGGELIKKESKMLAILAAVLVIQWLLGFLAFHVTGGFIHVLLMVGIIVLLLHFLRGRSAPSDRVLDSTTV
jgi:hypothetical protein